MDNRGQVSILIAVLFQVLFVLFAMVINVGLIVHEKINLQNSVDLAAYYGAMKQAQVLNAMAQVNYELRQIWKLFNFRLWVIGDIGRYQNIARNAEPPDGQAQPDHPDKTANSVPVVCVQNEYWLDYSKGKKGNLVNICQDPERLYPTLPAITLTPIQMIPGISEAFVTFQRQSQQNAANYLRAFQDNQTRSYAMAASFFVSYKNAVAQRRIVMHKLQDLLIQNRNDFKDLSGQSVGDVAQRTLTKNLTPSLTNLNFTFENSLSNKPFLVPIDVRVLVYYQANPGGGTQMTVLPLSQPPSGISSGLPEILKIYLQTDLGSAVTEAAQSFEQEPIDYKSDPYAFASLEGFEKDPWVMAYVRVAATATTRMLFAPFSLISKTSVTLSAESYAMPFGGKLGPWYFNQWPNGSSTSSGDTNKVDSLLPARLSTGGSSGPAPIVTPNYSRFPGDTWGMMSGLAKYFGFRGMAQITPTLDNYSSLEIGLEDPSFDPVVSPITNPNSPQGLEMPLRILEKAAIAPDLFDATYYSINYDWETRLGNDATPLLSDLCNGQCYMLGTDRYSSSQKSSNAEIKTLIAARNTSAGQFSLAWGNPFWLLQTPEQVNTSWSQGEPGQYDGAQAQSSSGAPWGNGGKPGGGRAGYSVKIVSKQYLQGPFDVGGANTSPGPLANPPQ